MYNRIINYNGGIMIEIKNLYLQYTKEYYTLNDINLVVNKGEHVILHGEIESGKSSLIRVIAGLEKPTKGQVLINQTPLHEINFKSQFNLGYLSGFGAFFNGKTVRANLEYVLRIRGFSKTDSKNLVNSAIMLNKLENLADVKIKILSEYDKLRVAIVRLSLRPLDLIVVDDIFEKCTKSEITKLSEMVNTLISRNADCTSIVAVNNLDTAQNFKGRMVSLKYGSITE